MRWYVIDKDYVNYLRRFDDKVQNVNYGVNSIKPFIGILININDINYCVPVSSPKSKHMYMNDSLDFIKLMNLNKTHLFGVINLNNMIPVKAEYMTPLNYKSIDKQAKFANETQKGKYIRLLKNELCAINEKADKITANARLLRTNCINYPKGKYALRSCNFALLEQKCSEYTQTKTQEQTQVNNQTQPQSLADKIKSAKQKSEKANQETADKNIQPKRNKGQEL